MSSLDEISKAKTMTDSVTLNDGNKMPVFGLGLYLTEPGSTAQQAILYSLKNGYRLLDTAQFYENEEDVGKAVLKSGVPREDIYIVNKVWDSSHGYEKTVDSVNNSLAKMKLTYIDLFLIHSPGQGQNVETYKALLDLQAQGKIRSVGVSNYGEQHLAGLQKAGLKTPAVNQVELHPFCRRESLVKYCRDKGIVLMGYCPLVRTKKHNDPDLIAMAKKYTKSVSQVLIRWGLDSGFVTIPKSKNPERIQENCEVFDFKLGNEDKQLLNSKSERVIVSWDPTVAAWKG